MEGKTQQTSAAMAGMSERSARKWQCGPLPSETKTERHWRTRPDPFDGVWEEEILPLLQGEAAGGLRATTIIEWLEEQHPGRYSASQLRTLQRRLQDWRALNGPDQEVYFPQEHPPGREAQLDFTHCNSLGVTIGGRPYRHLLFQLVLSHSGWRYAEVATGETFLALKRGLQNALWQLGGVPRVIRSDNTSALTHEIKRSRGRALNDNYAELLDHYGLESTLINSGESHENGVAEQANYAGWFRALLEYLHGEIELKKLPLPLFLAMATVFIFSVACEDDPTPTPVSSPALIPTPLPTATAIPQPTVLSPSPEPTVNPKSAPPATPTPTAGPTVLPRPPRLRIDRNTLRTDQGPDGSRLERAGTQRPHLPRCGLRRADRRVHQAPVPGV